VIRPARREDARELAELEVRAWRWAYVDIVDEADMITVEAREHGWRDGPIEGAHVAEVGGRLVGVVQFAPRDDEPGVGVLHRLYVEPAAQGAGVGAALHDLALAQLRDALGMTAATLWVFAGNGHARGFYERRGWRPDGTAGEWAGVPELRYRHTLVP
jgi:GNAT superfamily N-acetyltransferase